jgi:hypothetical protein
MALYAEGGMDGGEDAEAVQVAEGGLGGRIVEDAGEFVVEAGATDTLEVGGVALEVTQGAALDAEIKAGGIAGGAEHAGGVVLEGAVVEGADETSFEIGDAVGGVQELAAVGAVEAEGEGVDGEVAAVEVLLDGGRGCLRESAGAGVGFGAGGGDVDG